MNVCKSKINVYRSKADWEKVIAVTNRRLCSNDFLEQIKKIGDLGVKAVILREKDLTPKEYECMAEKVLCICEVTDTTCILHNFPQAARNLGCKNLHLPMPVLDQVNWGLHENLTVNAGTEMLTDGMDGKPVENGKTCEWRILGTSVHSLSQAMQAEALGATYMTAGHVFETDCKKGLAPRGIDFLQNICQTVQVPVYGIGGIHPDNMEQVLAAGAAGVCMMSELMRM